MKTHGEIIARAKRTAQNIGGIAPEVVEFVLQCEDRLGVSIAHDRHYPPVAVLAAPLLVRFEKSQLTLAIRQLIGTTVSGIMARQGYVPDNSGVRIAKNPLFKSGATYRLAGYRSQSNEFNILYRMVKGLDADEIALLREAIDAVEQDRDNDHG